MTHILLVTLSHNRQPLIGQAIKSVLSQTLPSDKFSYLIFDNNSTDNAKKIVQMVSNKYKHIHAHFSSTNLGQQKAYNLILESIIPDRFPEAEIFCILDDDDQLMPDALSSVYEFFSKHPEIGASYSDFSIIDGRGNIRVKKHGKAKMMMPNQFSKEGQLMLRRRFISNNVCGHFRCYRISALRDVGGFPTERKYATDYCMFGRIMEKRPVVKIDKILYQFRQHKFGQIESKESPQQTLDWHYYMEFYKKRWTKMGLI